MDFYQLLLHITSGSRFDPRDPNMIGAIAGDMIGSPYEGYPIKTKDFEIRVAGFTDDTVLTVAVANAILTGIEYTESMVTYAGKYPHAGFGGAFRKWMWQRESKPFVSGVRILR